MEEGGWRREDGGGKGAPSRCIGPVLPGWRDRGTTFGRFGEGAREVAQDAAKGPGIFCGILHHFAAYLGLFAGVLENIFSLGGRISRGGAGKGTALVPPSTA